MIDSQLYKKICALCTLLLGLCVICVPTECIPWEFPRYLLLFPLPRPLNRYPFLFPPTLEALPVRSGPVRGLLENVGCARKIKIRQKKNKETLIKYFLPCNESLHPPRQKGSFSTFKNRNCQPELSELSTASVEETPINLAMIHRRQYVRPTDYSSRN